MISPIVNTSNITDVELNPLMSTEDEDVKAEGQRIRNTPLDQLFTTDKLVLR